MEAESRPRLDPTDLLVWIYPGVFFSLSFKIAREGDFRWLVVFALLSAILVLFFRT